MLSGENMSWNYLHGNRNGGMEVVNLNIGGIQTGLNTLSGGTDQGNSITNEKPRAQLRSATVRCAILFSD